MTRPRLVDVARLAGVGIGTASDALAGKNRIPEETRDRVRNAAESLGYVPNPLARALSAGRLPILAIVITALRRPDEFEPYRTYWGDLIGAATLAAADRGYAMVVLPGLVAANSVALPVSGMVVVTTHEEDPDLELALRLGVPVLGDGYQEDPRAAGWVDLDYGTASPLVMDHFVERGSRRPAMLCAMATNKFVVHLRSEHTKWCAATGIDHVEICTEGVVTHEAAAIGALLDDGVDAVFTAAESVQTALDVVVERGLEVGRDVLIATLDDDIDGSLAQRGITTVGLNGRNYAEDVVAALVDIVEGRLQPPVVVPAQLTVHPRATTNGRP